jgi:phage repressor protein C with HTH and peptisase S24 domain
MAPTLAEGDVLLIHAGAARARPGRIAVLELPGDRPLAVKRLGERRDGGWWVERDNPAEGVDSWLVGALAETALRGVALARVWPRPRRL